MSMIPLLVLGQAIVAGNGQNPNSSGQLDSYYNRRGETTFAGTVSGKTKATTPGRSQGMSLLIRSGKTIREVEIGPAWFVGRQQASINLGDSVRVTAAPVQVNGKRVYIARQIRRGNQILALRTASGQPYWRPTQTTQVASNSNQSTNYSGTITGTSTFDVNGEQYAGYIVNTPNGPMNVAMAPSWYWNNQPAYFQVGQPMNFTVNGSGLGRPLGGGVTLANSFAYGGGSLVLPSFGPNLGSFGPYRP